MVRRSRLAAVAAVFVAGTVVVPAQAAQAWQASQASQAGTTPTVRVWPGSRLEGGDVVSVRAAGLPPNADVVVSQCTEEPGFDFGVGCYNGQTVRTDARGRLRVAWTLLDPVFYQPEAGSPVPRYCRADLCRIWVTAPTDEGPVNIPSAELHFVGRPATIAVAPSSGLVDGQRVRVTGSAKGSDGRWIRLIQQQCIQIVQEFSCSGATPLATVRLGHHDTFATNVRVRRYLDNGTDCAVDIFYEDCRITAVVIGPDGRPDDSFGVSSLGHPGAFVTFAPPV